jgi:dihydrofolate synthase/folylpolyglutamate synthase
VSVILCAATTSGSLLLLTFLSKFAVLLVTGHQLLFAVPLLTAIGVTMGFAAFDSRRGLIDRVQPSFFEITTAMAFQYFAEQEVDIAIVEVGLGGRFDSTNILHPLLSVITNIGYDHQQFLGDTLPEIAREKAGIIKHRVPVIIGEEQDETTEVFEEMGHQQEAGLFFTSKHCYYEITDQNTTHLSFSVYQDDKKVFHNLTTDCPASFQLRNILTTLQALNYLPSPFSITKDAVDQGLRKVRKQTGLMGRWQILSHQPLTIADGAHNKEGILEVTKQLNPISYSNLRIVYGCVADKQVDELLPLFPANAMFYLCEPAIDRKMPLDQLSNTAHTNGLHYNSFNGVKEAYQAARNDAGDNDLIFVGGSIFVVAEIIR